MLFLAAAGALFLIIIFMNISAHVTICGEQFSRDQSSVHLHEKTLSKEDIEKFSKFTCLTTLTLKDCTLEADDLSPLLRPDLRSFCLSGSSLNREQAASLDLSGLQALNYLDLSGCGAAVNDPSIFTPVAPGLVELSVSGTSLSDMSVAASMENLKILNASDCGIRDISPLSGLTKLEKADLSGNSLESIVPLSEAENLTKLNVSRNALKDLTGIEKNLHLAVLNADDNRIENLDSLTNATILEDVSLQNNEITDITVLGKSISSLSRLNLSGNQVTDLSALSNSPVLKELNISGNKVQTLDFLAGCTALESLYASHNTVSSMNTLSSLPQLKFLDLSYNALEGRTDPGSTPAWAQVSDKEWNLSHNQITGVELPEGSWKQLDLHANQPLNQPLVTSGSGSLYKIDCDTIILDYSEGIDWQRLSDAGFRRYIVLDCPLDKQISLEDLFDYKLTLMTAQEYEAEESGTNTEQKDSSGPADNEKTEDAPGSPDEGKTGPDPAGTSESGSGPEAAETLKSGSDPEADSAEKPEEPDPQGNDRIEE